VFTWLIAIVLFFPVFWMVLTAFKPEVSAYTVPPQIIFHPTLSEFAQVLSGGILKPFEHSAFVDRRVDRGGVGHLLSGGVRPFQCDP